MKKQSDYWAKNVLSWEKGAYYRNKEIEGKFRFVDRLSIYFRGDSIYRRADHAYELLKDTIVDKEIIDVGCASGRFARKLIRNGAKKVVGVDVSEEGVDLAKKLTLQEKMQDKIDFVIQDATNADSPLPPGYLTIALGVIEYFDENSLKTFLTNINSPYYFLSFPLLTENKKTSLREILRSIYLKVQSCPGIYYYTLDSFVNLCSVAGLPSDARIVEYKGTTFVTNLDVSNTL